MLKHGYGYGYGYHNGYSGTGTNFGIGTGTTSLLSVINEIQNLHLTTVPLTVLVVQVATEVAQFCMISNVW